MTSIRRTYAQRLMRGVGLLLSVIVLSMAFGEGFLRLCPASVLPADLQQGLHAEPHDVGLSHPTIGVLEQPFWTGVLTGPDFQAVYHTDGHGFRNTSPWPPEADLVMLGDAVAFGYGVEDAQAWPAPSACPSGSFGTARYRHARPHTDLSSPGRHRGATLLSGRWLSQCTGPSVDRSQCVTLSHWTGTDRHSEPLEAGGLAG